MELSALYKWFMSLGENYGVNPIVFGVIYIGAIPFFTLSLGWLVRNIKRKKPFILPLLSTGFFFISAYLYLIIAGKNVPIWVYGFVVALILLGAYSTFNKVKSQIKEGDNGI